MLWNAPRGRFEGLFLWKTLWKASSHSLGRQQFHAAELDSAGDHRIVMAFAVAALSADGPCTIEGSEAAAVSFPEFFSTLRQIAK